MDTQCFIHIHHIHSLLAIEELCCSIKRKDYKYWHAKYAKKLGFGNMLLQKIIFEQLELEDEDDYDLEMEYKSFAKVVLALCSGRVISIGLEVGSWLCQSYTDKLKLSLPFLFSFNSSV